MSDFYAPQILGCALFNKNNPIVETIIILHKKQKNNNNKNFRNAFITYILLFLQVFPISEKDPVKLSIHHYPVCTTYAFFINPEDTEQKVIVKDPSNIEEAVMDGKIVLGMNPYKEICTLHLAGKMLIDKNVVLKLTHSAIENSKVAVELIKNAIQR